MNKYGTIQKVRRCKRVCVFQILCEFADILTVVFPRTCCYGLTALCYCKLCIETLNKFTECVDTE